MAWVINLIALNLKVAAHVMIKSENKQVRT